MLRKLVLLSWIMGSVLISVCHAEILKTEAVLNFVSHIIVNKDASLDVTETISVYAAQQQIKYGIVRWLPTFYIDNYGVKHRVNYEVKKILVNNTPTPFQKETTANKFGISIGNNTTLLSPGTYFYTIEYHVNNAIDFSQNENALFWNITGNDWDFPILFAEADIKIPQQGKILTYAANTGMVNQRGKNFAADSPADNEISIELTRALKPGEALSVAITWPTGVVEEPTFFQQMNIDPKQWITVLVYLVAAILLIILGYRIKVIFRKK